MSCKSQVASRKSYHLSLVTLLLVTCHLSLVTCSWGAIEDIPVVVSGKYIGTIDMYSVGKELYLDVEDVGKVYGGQSYWYPVSGRILIRFKRESVKFMISSDKTMVGSAEVKLPYPILIRANKAFIPLDFFLTRAFAELVDMDTSFDPGTRLISIEKRSNVGPIQHFSYADHTRVVVEMGSALSFQSSEKGQTRIDFVFPNGQVDWTEEVRIQDGLVNTLSFVQERGHARLVVSLEQKPLRVAKSELGNPRRLVVDFFRSQSPSTVSSSQLLKRRIVVDPGHGGKDSGAVGRYRLVEKEVALWVAKELAKLLQEEDQFEVLLTRDSDKFIPLSDRSQMSNEFKADVFISVHCNAHKDKREQGFEIYYLSEKPSDPSAESVAQYENASLEFEGKAVDGEKAETTAHLLGLLARNEFINEAGHLSALMAKEVKRRTDLPYRGVKQAGFYVLSGTYAPAVLVEMGFLTNAGDAAKLSNRSFRKKLVSGLYAGILAYAKNKEWLEHAKGR